MLILLMGNPNVGKSAVFSRLTGANVIVSNYPGTTVEFTGGRLRVDGDPVDVIDVPGTYALEPSSRAEDVAVEMVAKADVIVNVVDATNLERNLNLTVQLLQTGKPMLVVLNMWDEATARGTQIDLEKLEEELTVPVVATCALSGEGIKRLTERLGEARPGSRPFEEGEKWHVIGDIVEHVQRVTHRHPTVGEKISHATVHPVWGPLLALVVLFISFEVVRFIGEGLITYVFEPAFDHLWLPVMTGLSVLLGGEGLLHDLLIGHLVDGRHIDFGQSFGLLTSGLYIPFAAVLPYIFAFYLALSLLEDIGYLPR
ncbi:MAG TPA: FeoB small GTPase domain-containing protein, partial [Planctomycetota bacterium]|nr:FeoB small GTPase domain-containing protein [Planctomycetota bacterium]